MLITTHRPRGSGSPPGVSNSARSHIHRGMVDLVDGGRVDYLRVAHRRCARARHQRIFLSQIRDDRQRSLGRLRRAGDIHTHRRGVRNPLGDLSQRPLGRVHPDTGSPAGA